MDRILPDVPHHALGRLIATLLMILCGTSLTAQSGDVVGPALVRENFLAYEYYHELPATQNGVPVPFLLSGSQIEFLRARLDPTAPEGFARLARNDENHWMGLQVLEKRILLRIRDFTNAYNCRLDLDLDTGGLVVLRGVNYQAFSTTEDAALSAYLALGFLDRLMAGEMVFVADLAIPPAWLAAERPDQEMMASAESSSLPIRAELPPGYIVVDSNASIAAAELFAAGPFGDDRRLEEADLDQIEMLYVTTVGNLVRMPQEDLLSLAYGSLGRRDREPKLGDVLGRIERISTEQELLYLVIHPMQMVFNVSPVEAMDGMRDSTYVAMEPGSMAREVFDLLDRIGRTRDTYGTRSGMDIPIEDFEVYAWMRMQRSGSSTSSYPRLIDSGGALEWGDFALLAAVRLAGAGIENKIVIIERPEPSETRYHAICLYRTLEGWRWMDNGRLGEDTSAYWDRLPAIIYGEDVRFRVSDIRAEWLDHAPNRDSGWLISRLDY